MVEHNFVPKIRREVLAGDEEAPCIIETIFAAAHTGRIGDGKIWVQTVEEVARVRTGERGAEAI